MVPANSCKIPRVPHYSGAVLTGSNFHIRDYHALWWDFPLPSVNSTSAVVLGPTTPIEQAQLV